MENQDDSHKEKKKNDLTLPERAAVAVGTGVVKVGVKVAKASGEFGAHIAKGIVKNIVGAAIEEKKQEMKDKFASTKENLKDKVQVTAGQLKDKVNQIKPKKDPQLE
jgi:hypothetical protein